MRATPTAASQCSNAVAVALEEGEIVVGYSLLTIYTQAQYQADIT